MTDYGSSRSPYRPKSCLEKADFVVRFCAKCDNDHRFDDPDKTDDDKGCRILTESGRRLLWGSAPEWVMVENGPTCVEFKPRNHRVVEGEK